jgi:hypothetical protein
MVFFRNRLVSDERDGTACGTTPYLCRHHMRYHEPRQKNDGRGGLHLLVHSRINLKSTSGQPQIHLALPHRATNDANDNVWRMVQSSDAVVIPKQWSTPHSCGG